MTSIPPITDAVPRRVEISSGKVEIRYADGSLLIDNDASSEPGSPASVDIFRIGKAPNFVVTQDRFRADARRWGSVRDALAGPEEVRGVQSLFAQTVMEARFAFDAFHNSVDAGRFSIQRATDGRWQLRYTDPRTGTERICRFSPERSPADGRLPRFESIALEQDGTDIVISDDTLLAGLRPELDVVYRRLLAANRP